MLQMPQLERVRYGTVPYHTGTNNSALQVAVFHTVQPNSTVSYGNFSFFFHDDAWYLECTYLFTYVGNFYIMYVLVSIVMNDSFRQPLHFFAHYDTLCDTTVP